MFASKKEIIYSVFALVMYVINKFGISKQIYCPFLNNYLNDFIGGYVFATILVISYRFWIKREITIQIYLIIITLASIYWEYIAPLYLSYSVKDAKDIVAYLIGGVVFWILIKERNEKYNDKR